MLYMYLCIPVSEAPRPVNKELNNKKYIYKQKDNKLNQVNRTRLS